MRSKDVIVIGAGPAGMSAAIAASQNGKRVLLIERNKELGKKLKITGGGRCNLTNGRDISEFFDKVVRNNKFLYTSLYSFTNDMLIEFFKKEGVEFAQEADMKIYPAGGKSEEIIAVLGKALRQNGVEIMLGTKVEDIIVENGNAKSVKTAQGEEYCASSIIIAPGGKSYPNTGSDGNMIQILKDMGHNVNSAFAALAPIKIQESWIKDLSGISVKAKLEAFSEGKALYSETGDILFTHFGISGPLVFCASSYISRHIENGDVEIVLDMAPEFEKGEISAAIRSQPNRAVWNNLKEMLPLALAKGVIAELGVSEYPHSLVKADEEKIIDSIKRLRLRISKIMDIDSATVTSGGIDVKEIDPQTMRSKIVDNVFFAGEVIDVDALTGGYNLQIAFSTGYVAGINA